MGFGLSKTKRKVFDPVGNEQVGQGGIHQCLKLKLPMRKVQQHSYLSSMAHEEKRKQAEVDKESRPASATMKEEQITKGYSNKPSQNFGSKKSAVIGTVTRSPFRQSKKPRPGTYGEKRTSFKYKPEEIDNRKIGFDSTVEDRASLRRWWKAR